MVEPNSEPRKLSASALAKIQTGANVIPDTDGCATALDAIMKTKEFDDDRLKRLQEMREKMGQQTIVTPPLQKEIINVKGFSVTKDFFTCLTLCLINLNNKKINEILDSFGFTMADANGKTIYPRKKTVKKSKKVRR